LLDFVVVVEGFNRTRLLYCATLPGFFSKKERRSKCASGTGMVFEKRTGRKKRSDRLTTHMDGKANAPMTKRTPHRNGIPIDRDLSVSLFQAQSFCIVVLPVMQEDEYLQACMFARRWLAESLKETTLERTEETTGSPKEI